MSKEKYERAFSRSISKTMMLGILFDEIMADENCEESTAWNNAKVLYKVYLKQVKEDSKRKEEKK